MSENGCLGFAEEEQGITLRFPTQPMDLTAVAGDPLPFIRL